MSRSGYSDDCDGWDLIRWRGAVNSAIKGKRGQALLSELAAAMDAMPVKELVPNEFAADGGYCALGVVGAARCVDVSQLDPEDRSSPARALDIAEALAAEVMFINDADYDDWRWEQVEICGPMRPYQTHRRSVRMDNPDVKERRWNRVRAWVQKYLATPKENDQ